MRKFLILLVACHALYGQLLPQREHIPFLQEINKQVQEATAAPAELQLATTPMREKLTALQRTIKIANRFGLSTTQQAVDELATIIPLVERYGRREKAEMLRGYWAKLQNHLRAASSAAEEAARGADRDNLRRYRLANAQLAPPSEAGRRVLFFGDSITDGWKLTQYFPGKDYVNRGISGQITGEMLGRMQADVIANQPAALIILAGTNDLARGVPIETIQDNLRSITELAEFHKIKVILSSILPVSDYHAGNDPQLGRTATRPPAMIRQLNQWMAKLCRDRGYTYLNYMDSLSDPSGLLRADYAEDGLHPNEAGYKVMAPLAQAAIDKTLGTP